MVRETCPEPGLGPSNLQIPEKASSVLLRPRGSPAPPGGLAQPPEPLEKGRQAVQSASLLMDPQADLFFLENTSGRVEPQRTRQDSTVDMADMWGAAQRRAITGPLPVNWVSTTTDRGGQDQSKDTLCEKTNQSIRTRSNSLCL